MQTVFSASTYYEVGLLLPTLRFLSPASFRQRANVLVSFPGPSPVKAIATPVVLEPRQNIQAADAKPFATHSTRFVFTAILLHLYTTCSQRPFRCYESFRCISFVLEPPVLHGNDTNFSLPQVRMLRLCCTQRIANSCVLPLVSLCCCTLLLSISNETFCLDFSLDL